MSRPILVADFDFTRRYVTASVLRSAGHVVVEAGDADEAEAALAQHRCTLAFIAMRLSGRDGIELCRQWSARGVRVVLVAADFRGSELWRRRANDAGAAALLSSLLDREKIVSLAHRLLDSQQSMHG